MRHEFDKGERNKHKKADPQVVAESMRRVMKDDPENPGMEIPQFEKNDWLTAQQVTSMFGRFRRERTEKGKKATIVHDDEELATEYNIQEYHQEILNLEDRANTELPIAEQDHPFKVSFFLQRYLVHFIRTSKFYRSVTGIYVTWFDITKNPGIQEVQIWE